MKKWFLLACLITSFASAEQFPLTDFHGGCNTYHSSLLIADNEVQDCLNTIFDGVVSVQKREGFVLQATTGTSTFTNGISYTDASSSKWIIAFASDAIRAQQTNGNFNVLIATVPITAVNGITAFNKVWFVDQVQGVYSWDGTTTVFIAGSPHGKFIDKFKNRLVVSGLNSPNQSQVYLSKFLDGTVWTSGSLATDPAILTVGLQDASDVVTGLFGGFNDALIVFKRQSIAGIFGTDQNDFNIRVLNSEVGTIDSRSIQPLAGGLIFVSLRGVEYFNGAISVIISDKIRNKLDSVINSAFSYKTWTQTSQSDFAAGSISPANSLSTSLVPGDVVGSSFSITENQSALQWGPGYGTATNLTVGANSISLTTNNSGNISDNGFEGGSGFSFSSSWTNSGMARQTILSVGCSIVPRSGSTFASGGFNGTSPQGFFEILDKNLTVVGADYFTLPIDCAWNFKTFGDATLTGKRVYFRFGYVDGTVTQSVRTASSYIFGGSVVYYMAGAKTGSTVAVGYDDITTGSSTITTGSFVSQRFDTGMLSSTAQLQATWTADDIVPYFELQHSAGSLGPFTQVITSTGTNKLVNRYLRYIATMTVTGSGNAISTIDSVGILSRSSGTFYSAVNYAPNLSIWDIFSANTVDNSGSHAFFIRASTNSFTVSSSTPAWSAIANNSVITIATGTYQQIRDDFGVTASTADPRLQNFSINFYEGTPPPLMASAVFDDRYYLSLTTSTVASANDATLVLNRQFNVQNPVWSIYDIKTGAFVVHLGRLYHGNNAANGKWYLDGGIYSDNNQAITSYIKTKDYALGDISLDKYFNSLYLFAENLGDYPISTKYYLDKASTGYNLSTVLQNESSGFMRRKLPFPISSSNANFGRTIAFKFENSVIGNQMQLLGGILVYKPAALIK